MKTNLLILFLIATVYSYSQNTTDLDYYGPVYEISNPDFETDLNREIKAVFDVSTKAEKEGQLNKNFVTVARFLRLHQKSNLKRNSVKAALIVHGSAIFDLLSHSAYAEYHQKVDLINPNYDLLTVLSEYDVDIILCGQTSNHRSVDQQELHPKVKIALSAMSAHITLDKNGYTLINF
ncbi:DsrE family protein [Psychroflexus tropicus]|uniref:DsrE family protein n=1 Tax=Psychroflexus tropicus TaxID=197345 RepID=UPI0003713223|nr:DsrE family protein [Psychroflexus tropicus]